jgi:uncharacterized protein
VLKKPYQYRPALFFALAFAVSWGFWMIGALAGAQAALRDYAPLFSLIGLIGPIGATLYLVFSSGNTALKCDFKQRLLDVRKIGPGYAAFAVLMPFAVMVGAILLSFALGEPRDQLSFADGAQLLPMILLAMILAPIMEETGWHGYGVDALRSKFGLMATTLLFALLWCLWHAPLVLIPGTYQSAVAGMENKLFIANFFASVVPVGIIANWFYYRCGRSILASMLLHSMLNAAAVLINAGQTAKCIATLLFAGVAAALMLFDRGLFAEGPRNFLAKKAAAGVGRKTKPTRRHARA